jgi:hypothetical protein
VLCHRKGVGNKGPLSGQIVPSVPNIWGLGSLRSSSLRLHVPVSFLCGELHRFSLNKRAVTTTVMVRSAGRRGEASRVSGRLSLTETVPIDRGQALHHPKMPEPSRNNQRRVEYFTRFQRPYIRFSIQGSTSDDYSPLLLSSRCRLISGYCPTTRRGAGWRDYATCTEYGKCEKDNRPEKRSVGSKSVSRRILRRSARAPAP